MKPPKGTSLHRKKCSELVYRCVVWTWKRSKKATSLWQSCHSLRPHVVWSKADLHGRLLHSSRYFVKLVKQLQICRDQQFAIFCYFGCWLTHQLELPWMPW